MDKIEEPDAYDFMDAVDHGLVTYEKGAFVAACSRLKEYMFWEGLRTGVPRRLTLWLEPIITIAGLRRLQRDFGWPPDRLGMQSSTWAFDFVGYAADQETEVIVCEVKRTKREVDSLLELMELHALHQRNRWLSSKGLNAMP